MLFQDRAALPMDFQAVRADQESLHTRAFQRMRTAFEDFDLQTLHIHLQQVDRSAESVDQSIQRDRSDRHDCLRLILFFSKAKQDEQRFPSRAQ